MNLLVGRYQVFFISLYALFQTHNGQQQADFDDYNLKDPPTNLAPTFSQLSLDYKTHKADFTQQTHNPNIVSIVIWPTSHNLTSNDKATTKLLVSTNGAKSFSSYEVYIDGEPIYVKKVVPLKGYMFCLSLSNDSFFYIDNNLKRTNIVKFSKDVLIAPHLYHPKYIYKLRIRDTKNNVSYHYFINQ
ncbi:hypothetical protein RF11_02375 [Thelohanellus kitauei]|uniref:Uncharacterized protein n=1 Tax=Thelohanellus kitauei TaxID=669202 RepID=A0A0C2I5K0_THEKT|nr:hypothetical protein RF11_02375 [Thelohanellus kitauei]